MSDSEDEMVEYEVEQDHSRGIPYSPSSYNNYSPDDASDYRSRSRSRSRSRPDNPDRISGLPDSLILHILSFLRMKQVIRTGVLSKRWHLLWTSAHTLLFNYSGQHHHGITKFLTFVDDTLLLCQASKVKKFSVDFVYNHRYIRHVNKWMIFIKNKHVEELDLYLRRPGSSEIYDLPQIMYSNMWLQELSLCRCNLVPKGEINWPSLRFLEIKYAELSQDVIEKICFGCPALESLKFGVCSGVDCFNIDSKSVKKLVISGYWRQNHEDSNDDELKIYAENVTSLEIRGCFQKRILVLANVRALVDAKLDFFRKTDDYEDEIDFKTDEKMLKKVFISLQHVVKLSIGGWLLQVLTTMEIRNLSCPRMACKYLTLNTKMSKWELPGIALLLQSCPQVEILNINMGSPTEYHIGLNSTVFDDFNEDDYWISRPCWVQQLKTLKIDGIEANSVYYRQLSLPIIPFLQTVLKNAMVLEQIIIDSFRDDTETWISPIKYRIIQKLLSFPRSSRDAVILLTGRQLNY